MVYDQKLAQRLTFIVAQRKDMHEQKMFGGVGYLLRGNMCFGIWKDHLIVRIGHENALKVQNQKSVKPFDITGRPMKGWLMVSPAGIKTPSALQRWTQMAIDFVAQLPRK